MKYRNTKTGAVIETASVLSGGDWEIVEEKAAEKNEAEAKKPTAEKKVAASEVTAKTTKKPAKAKK